MTEVEAEVGAEVEVAAEAAEVAAEAEAEVGAVEVAAEAPEVEAGAPEPETVLPPPAAAAALPPPPMPTPLSNMPPPTPYPAAAYPPPNVPAPAPQVPKKSNKGLFIILGAVALVVVLAIAGVVGFNVYRSNAYDNAVKALDAGEYQAALDAFAELDDYRDAAALKERARKWLDYKAAQALLDAEDYEAALEGFKALGSFENAAELAAQCQNSIDYRAAVVDFATGDFEAALDAFRELTSSDFLDSDQWVDKTAYAIADKKYTEGDLYGAYLDFQALAGYEDASERARQCTTPYPTTGELYHNGAYASSASAITIDAVNVSYMSYYKIYVGDDLVSTLFLNAGTSCTIEVPPGNYTIKEAAGETWFGEEILFGDEGSYEVLKFDDGNDYFVLEYNIEVTFTLEVLDGDVGSSPIARENF
jgi:tetratricopeptide (TPR) repeat protein